MTKQDHIPAVIAFAGSQGHDEIKANLPDDDEFDTPITYERQADEEAFIPDVTGKSLAGKSYFEVILKTDKTRRLISKLKLMSVLAGRKSGNLYLMAPRGNYQFAKDIMDNNQIVADLIKMK